VQARALQRFGATLAAVTRSLRALHPPAVLAPAHRERIRDLGATRRVTRGLRAALAAHDARSVAVLLRRFRAAARGSRGPSAVERQARARYAERLRELSDAYRAVRRETARLQRALS
jgi:hypothetical protein